LRLNVSQGLPPKFLTFLNLMTAICAAARALLYMRLSDLSRKSYGLANVATK
jgi:hypothetical protein